MNYSLLAYLFICFSIALVCLGVVAAVVHHTRSPVARALLAFYAFLTVSVLAGLLLSFLDVLPGSVAPETQTVLEYLEAMVGFYGILFTLPLFAHRVFAVPSGRRDRILLAIVGVAFVAQHVTEYGFGGRWDKRGDFFENLLFAAVVAYTLALGIRRLGAPGVDRTLYRRAGTAIETSVPPEWNLTERESEVVSLVLRGLSNKEIAAKLFISANTVKTHLRAVFDKSGCRSRFALMSAVASVRVPTGNPAENAIH